MGRYKAPEKRGSPYITPQGHQSLTLELKALWKKRAKVTQILSEAAAEGDRSENAEYIYRKKQLREMDRRIRYLQKRLDELKIVDTIPGNTQCVYFGAWVTVEDQSGKTECYRIVGPDEFDVAKSWISMDSPMARALMKKSLDDEIEVDLPGGKKSFFIADIQYKKNDET